MRGGGGGGGVVSYVHLFIIRYNRIVSCEHIDLGQYRAINAMLGSCESPCLQLFL